MSCGSGMFTVESIFLSLASPEVTLTEGERFRSLHRSFLKFIKLVLGLGLWGSCWCSSAATTTYSTSYPGHFGPKFQVPVIYN